MLPPTPLPPLQVTAIFGSSVEVQVSVWGEAPESGEAMFSCGDAFATVVQLGPGGRPEEVPFQLLPETEAERLRAAGAPVVVGWGVYRMCLPIYGMRGPLRNVLQALRRGGRGDWRCGSGCSSGAARGPRWTRAWRRRGRRTPPWPQRQSGGRYYRPLSQEGGRAAEKHRVDDHSHAMHFL